MEVNVISSQLYNAASETSVPWKSRLRACFAVEYLILKKEKYYKFFKANSAKLGNIDIGFMKSENPKGGQELEKVMLSVKSMFDKGSFANLSMGIEDNFDPMAMQKDLPDKVKNKGLNFMNKGGSKVVEDDLLGGDIGPIVKSESGPEKKKDAFGFIKKKADSGLQENPEVKKVAVGGGLSDFDFLGSTGNDSQDNQPKAQIQQQVNNDLSSNSNNDLLANFDSMNLGSGNNTITNNNNLNNVGNLANTNNVQQQQMGMMNPNMQMGMMNNQMGMGMKQQQMGMMNNQMGMGMQQQQQMGMMNNQMGMNQNLGMGYGSISYTPTNTGINLNNLGNVKKSDNEFDLSDSLKEIKTKQTNNEVQQQLQGIMKSGQQPAKKDPFDFLNDCM